MLHFDDSYEHEVWNQCSEERVVFQLVLAHPDLGLGQQAIDCVIGKVPCTVIQRRGHGEL